MTFFRITYSLISAVSLFALQNGCRPGANFPEVFADAETHAVSARKRMDAADDPAVWYHAADPGKSLVIGTNKVAGLSVYNLQGEEIHFYPVGRVNNVDLRYGFGFGDGTRGDVIGCTERNRNEILLFRIDPDNGALSPVNAEPLLSRQTEIYGFCMYRSPFTNAYYAISNDKNGTVEQWVLSPAAEAGIKGEIARTRKVQGQPEGMVADDELAHLYIGEERRGIWKFPAEPDDSGPPALLQNSERKNNPAIRYDIEGLAIYYASGGRGYLIASSQGNNSFAVYTREGDHRYQGSLRIADSLCDGASETDGLEVCNLALGHSFASGMLVVQDGYRLQRIYSGPVIRPPKQ